VLDVDPLKGAHDRLGASRRRSVCVWAARHIDPSRSISRLSEIVSLSLQLSLTLASSRRHLADLVGTAAHAPAGRRRASPSIGYDHSH
jgi:hypothetical protein